MQSDHIPGEIFYTPVSGIWYVYIIYMYKKIKKLKTPKKTSICRSGTNMFRKTDHVIIHLTKYGIHTLWKNEILKIIV